MRVVVTLQTGEVKVFADATMQSDPVTRERVVVSLEGDELARYKPTEMRAARLEPKG